MTRSEGWHGWDDYAEFYDWENARTLGRRDVGFWTAIVLRESRRRRARVLELGCGTGRLLIPLARTDARVAGIDLSAPMLAYARRRVRRMPKAERPFIVRGDIRTLPFAAASRDVVIAPYGMLQSLVRDRDLTAVLDETHRVLRPGGLLGIDLVPDLPRWSEYAGAETFRGRMRGGLVTLVETVRQDRKRGLTTFHEQFTRRIGRRTVTRRFSLTFRTLPMQTLIARLERAGFEIEALHGDYNDGAWHLSTDVWIVLARKRR